jgi:hypothetical protein
MGPTKPPIQWIAGALSLGVKWTGSEADHSPPSSAKVKNRWICTSTLHYAIMAWCSVKAQGQIYLYLSRKKQILLAQDRIQQQTFVIREMKLQDL